MLIRLLSFQYLMNQAIFFKTILTNSKVDDQKWKQSLNDFIDECHEKYYCVITVRYVEDRIRGLTSNIVAYDDQQGR